MVGFAGLLLLLASSSVGAEAPSWRIERGDVHRGRGGIGGGLRLLVPGSEMVRFDVGWSDEGGFQFHFGSGSKPVAQRLRLR